MSKQDKVLMHLIKHRSITPQKACNIYGLYRLSAVIHRLRQYGFRIETTRMEYNGNKFAYYWLEDMKHNKEMLKYYDWDKTGKARLGKEK